MGYSHYTVSVWGNTTVDKWFIGLNSREQPGKFVWSDSSNSGTGEASAVPFVYAMKCC